MCNKSNNPPAYSNGAAKRPQMYEEGMQPSDPWNQEAAEQDELLYREQQDVEAKRYAAGLCVSCGEKRMPDAPLGMCNVCLDELANSQEWFLRNRVGAVGM